MDPFYYPLVIHKILKHQSLDIKELQRVSNKQKNACGQLFSTMFFCGEIRKNY